MTNHEPAPVRIELPLRHRDLDALGHVNQAVFHELLEEARGAFFRATLPDLPFTGYVLAHVELDYRREVRIENRYVIGECGVAALGRSRVELDNRLLLPDGTVAVEGRAVLVAWDEESRRSRELTQSEREALLSGRPD
jgi:acyl-CoA thioester hydrolase